MKKLIFIIGILSLILNSCSEENNISDSGQMSKFYYPLKVGNTWYYDSNISENNPWIKRIIEKEIFINDTKYFVVNNMRNFSSTSQNLDKDTVREDGEGRILRFTRGSESIYFDFSLNDGDTYTYFANPINSANDYNVTFKRVGKVETNKGTYDNCIGFFFDIPEFVDDEKWYIFAPNIGLVKETAGEGPTLTLNSYSLMEK